MSVRITAAGAVAIVCLSFLTAPVSACDERYIKKCEKASAAAAAAAEEAAAPAPSAKRKGGRVQVVTSRRSKHMHLVKRTRAPGFSRHEGRVTLASAESKMTTQALETPLARRFRGFISPVPVAQNAFEVWRRPHIVAVNLEPPMAAPADAPAAVEEPAPVAPAPATPAAAKQDRIAPQPVAMELASAESRPVTLPDPPAAKPVLATANAVPAPAPQVVVSASPPENTTPQPKGFSIPHLVLALCGALGAASAVRFMIGA
jgi:hypothetical protein